MSVIKTKWSGAWKWFPFFSKGIFGLPLALLSCVWRTIEPLINWPVDGAAAAAAFLIKTRHWSRSFLLRLDGRPAKYLGRKLSFRGGSQLFLKILKNIWITIRVSKLLRGRHFIKSQPLNLLSRDNGIQPPDGSRWVLQFWFWSGVDRTTRSDANRRKRTRDGGAISESGALSTL